MSKSVCSALAFATMFACGFLSPTAATAQDNILAELYGRGVHAYYAGRYGEAQQYLTSAIEGGLNDPRAYYFRGILAQVQGRPYEAETDWEAGAKLEASGNVNVAVGKSLSRFQGSARLKLEEIRRQARLEAASGGPTRSQVRMREIEAAQARPPVAAAARPPLPASSKPITAPPAPPTVDNPFADDAALAGGQPKVENDDALADAMNNPFKDDGGAGPAAAAAGGADVFGGGAADGADPFGGGADAGADPFGAAGDADPFGGGAAGGAMDDPFGGADPFGGN